MSYLLLFVLAILGVELFCRSGVVSLAMQLPILMNKSARVVTSRKISDHWKEKVLLRYARDIALVSLKISSALVIVAMVILLLFLFLEMLFPVQDSIHLLTSWLGGIFITVISFFYYFVRNKIIS